MIQMAPITTSMNAPTANGPSGKDGSKPVPPRLFNIVQQKVCLDVDMANQSVIGMTEITINPYKSDLKSTGIRLNCRQAEIESCTINGRTAKFSYNNPYSPFSKKSSSTNAANWKSYYEKVAPALQDPPPHELVINIPNKVSIEPADPLSVTAQQGWLGQQKARHSPDGAANGILTPSTPAHTDTSFLPLTLVIVYRIDRFRDGFKFQSCGPEDNAYPHCYTSGSPFLGSACCLFPTLEGLSERWVFELEITVPKTLGDIGRTKEEEEARTNGVPEANGTHNDGDVEMVDAGDEVEEDSDDHLKMVVAASGDLVSENVSGNKRTYKFALKEPVTPLHVFIAIGPFEEVDLGAEYRSSEEEEKMGRMLVDVKGYCLPGRSPLLRSTCDFAPRALDHLINEYGSSNYSTFRLVFVDDLTTDTVEGASVVLCSNSLLHNRSVIDADLHALKAIAYALAAQWSGVHVVPCELNDMWLTVGLAHYMANTFVETICGKNQFKDMIRVLVGKVLENDHGQLPLFFQITSAPVDSSSLEFVHAKATVVLTILANQMKKSSTGSPFCRVIRRIFLQSATGDLKNGLMSTSHFFRMCSKIQRSNLKPFFDQWIYGAGCPHFSTTWVYNKKRQVTIMTIKQSAGDFRPWGSVDLDDEPSYVQAFSILKPEKFLDDAKNPTRKDVADSKRPQYFSGPMTIRIHELNGMPYEHVVLIEGETTTIEFPHNTKYARVQRTRREKERQAAGTGVDINLDGEEPVERLYCLGDILHTDDDMAEWKLIETSLEHLSTKDSSSNPAFEWLNMDSDFEWLCSMDVQQATHMYISQLTQDIELVSQVEAVQALGRIGDAEAATVLVRTLMDNRYYYGVRIEAAKALAKCANAENDWLGQFHLFKAYEEFFCYPEDPSTPKPNDFSDYAKYHVQKAIPAALSMIRTRTGECPVPVKKWLINILNRSYNGENNFDDSYYIANLLEALANTLTKDPPNGSWSEDTEERHIHSQAIDCIYRFQERDEYNGSYHNIVTEVCLGIRRDLILRGIMQKEIRPIFKYTFPSHAPNLRAKAFECLVDLGIFREHDFTELLLEVLSQEQSCYIRHKLEQSLSRALGMLAYGFGTMTVPEVVKEVPLVGAGDLTMEDVDATMQARSSLQTWKTKKLDFNGAVDALKKAFKENEGFREGFWQATIAPQLELTEICFMLDVLRLFGPERPSLVVRWPKPIRTLVEYKGQGKLVFHRRPLEPHEAGPYLAKEKSAKEARGKAAKEAKKAATSRPPHPPLLPPPSLLSPPSLPRATPNGLSPHVPSAPTPKSIPVPKFFPPAPPPAIGPKSARPSSVPVAGHVATPLATHSTPPRPASALSTATTGSKRFVITLKSRKAAEAAQERERQSTSVSFTGRASESSQASSHSVSPSVSKKRKRDEVATGDVPTQPRKKKSRKQKSLVTTLRFYELAPEMAKFDFTMCPTPPSLV